MLGKQVFPLNFIYYILLVFIRQQSQLFIYTIGKLLMPFLHFMIFMYSLASLLISSGFFFCLHRCFSHVNTNRCSVSMDDVVFFCGVSYGIFLALCSQNLLKHYDDVKSNGRDKEKTPKPFQQDFIHSSLQIYCLIFCILKILK